MRLLFRGEAKKRYASPGRSCRPTFTNGSTFSSACCGSANSMRSIFAAFFIAPHLPTNTAGRNSRRQRMRLDYLRVRGEGGDLGKAYRDLLEAYDRGGLPFERVLTRLSYGRWLKAKNNDEMAQSVESSALEICRRYDMKQLEFDLSANRRPLKPRDAESWRRPMDARFPEDSHTDSDVQVLILDGPSDPLPPTIEELKRRKPRKRVGRLGPWPMVDDDGDSITLVVVD